MATEDAEASVGMAAENSTNIADKIDEMDMDKFTQVALASVKGLITSSNAVFSKKDDLDFFNTFKKFRDVVAVETSILKDIMSTILNQHCLKVNLNKLDEEEMFDLIVEANDIILEKVGIATDEATGQRKVEDPILITAVASKNINTSWNRRSDRRMAPAFYLLTAKNIARPQLAFKDSIDNTSGLFEPIIKEKPHALKPLAIIIEQTEYGEMFSHPYQCELDHFKPKEKHLHRAELKRPKPLEDTPLIYVDTITQLTELMDDLKCQSEIAVDLEHHSYRSFQGITCLIQISTREKDYIVDTLKLRSDLFVLNEVFTNPETLKVFHGADKDIEWLQRDFGVYVVNMFDTGQASRVLSFAHFSLAFLLKHYCQVDCDKSFQLADWRIRPLPEEMSRYAREDTHYLLYIYDCMKNELLDKGNLEKNLLLSVYQKSKLVCEKRYVKSSFNPDGYQTLYRKSFRVLNSQQLHALKELYAWRDKIARQEDESIGYVMPNHMLLQVAEVLPREMQGILACCNPVPTLVKQHLNELHQIIIRAREQSLVKPVTQQLQIQVDNSRHHFDMENVFHCPHDFSHLKDMETIDTGPTLLDVWNRFGDNIDKHIQFKIPNNITVKKAPFIPELASDNVTMNNIKDEKFSKVTSVFQSYNSPFDRYKLVKPLLDKNVTNETAVPEKSSNDEEKGVMEVKEHFMQLLSIHGKNNPNPEVEDSSVALEGDKEQTQANQDIQTIRKKFKLGGKKKKRRNKRTNPNEPNTAGARSVRKAKRLKINEADFKPFDYSQSDSTVLKRQKRDFKLKRKLNKKYFDPNSSVPQYKTVAKPSFHSESKLKSLTYTTKNPSQGGSSNLNKNKR